jgi:hypothetical protein
MHDFYCISCIPDVIKKKENKTIITNIFALSTWTTPLFIPIRLLIARLQPTGTRRKCVLVVVRLKGSIGQHIARKKTPLPVKNIIQKKKYGLKMLAYHCWVSNGVTTGKG